MCCPLPVLTKPSLIKDYRASVKNPPLLFLEFTLSIYTKKQKIIILHETGFNSRKFTKPTY
jgi:hypothetical protein